MRDVWYDQNLGPKFDWLADCSKLPLCVLSHLSSSIMNKANYTAYKRMQHLQNPLTPLQLEQGYRTSHINICLVFDKFQKQHSAMFCSYQIFLEKIQEIEEVE